MIIHLGWMLPSTSSGYLGTRRAPPQIPHLPCSRRGLPSSISHLMDWCAFTAPFHLYNVLRRCSLLSVALSIASPLLGVTQHPALRSPDFPHPDGNTTIETRPSTQLKPFYYTLSDNLKTTKSDYVEVIVSFTVSYHESSNSMRKDIVLLFGAVRSIVPCCVAFRYAVSKVSMSLCL